MPPPPGGPGDRIRIDVYSWKDVDKRAASLAEDGHAPETAQVQTSAGHAVRGGFHQVDDLLPIDTQANFIPARRAVVSTDGATR